MIESLVPLFGISILCLSARRIATANISRALYRAFFVTAVAIPIFFFAIGASSFTLWTLIGALSLILRSVPHISAKFRRGLTLDDSIQLLDSMILSMRAGFSLRTSLREAARDERKIIRRSAKDLYERLENGGAFGHRDALIGEILVDFRKIEARAVKTIETLQSMRSNFRVREDFRRRSGQISLQVRLQAALAIALFLPLLFVQWRAGHLFAIRTMVAVMLFWGAQIWIQVVFRRFKWKV